MKRLVLVALVLCAAGIAMAQGDQELLKPDASDWVHYSGSYDSHRHSPLNQITPANAANLQGKWVYHMNQQEAIQAVPIVYHGVMYVSQFNRVDAIDARSGNIVWQYQRQPLTRGAQRGTAIYDNKLFVTADGGSTLVAVDSRTGHTVCPVRESTATSVDPPSAVTNSLLL